MGVLRVDELKGRVEVGAIDVGGQALPRLHLDELELPVMLLVMAPGAGGLAHGMDVTSELLGPLHGHSRGKVEDDGRSRHLEFAQSRPDLCGVPFLWTSG